jgi:hypothetical protein
MTGDTMAKRVRSHPFWNLCFFHCRAQCFLQRGFMDMISPAYPARQSRSCGPTTRLSCIFKASISASGIGTVLSFSLCRQLYQTLYPVHGETQTVER